MIPNGFKTQTKAYGWSYLLMRESHVEFQVNQTSFDQKSKLGISLAVKSKASISVKPNGFKTQKKKPMVGLI